MSSRRARTQKKTNVWHCRRAQVGEQQPEIPGPGRRDMKGWWACGRARNRAASVRLMGVLMIMALLAATGGARPGLAADSVEAFYKGKTMQLLIGFRPGGGYVLYGRGVA